METWKQHLNSHYYISDLGDIVNSKTGRHLSQTSDGLGYTQVKLYVDGSMTNWKVYRLVWITFNGPVPSGLVVDHKDEDKLNSRLDNLQLLTYRQNTGKHYTTVKTLSRFTGVSFRKDRNKFRSYIKIKDKFIHLGYFTCELEAANAYQVALKQVA